MAAQTPRNGLHSPAAHWILCGSPTLDEKHAAGSTLPLSRVTGTRLDLFKANSPTHARCCCFSSGKTASTGQRPLLVKTQCGRLEWDLAACRVFGSERRHALVRGQKANYQKNVDFFFLFFFHPWSGTPW